MGYSTNFRGRFEFNKPLTDDMLKVYKKFHDERHEDGYQPNGKPSIWLQWEIVNEWGYTTYNKSSDEKLYLQWDEGEKFYKFVEWLEYLIKYVFKVWDVEISGKVEWRGEEWEDTGQIIVKDNVVVVESSY